MTRRASGLVLGVVLALLVLTLPGAVSADAPPVILDVRLDGNNHAVVTWTKTASQGSNNVKWSTDGTLGSYRDGSYGAPLADCQTGLRSNPARDSTWLYGRSCKGDDVPNTATRHVTRGELQVGVYYFQVSVAGNTIHETGATVSSVYHFSDVAKLTVTPARSGGEDDGTSEEEEQEKPLAEVKVTGAVAVHKTYLPKGKPTSGKVTIHAGDDVDTGAAPAKLVFADGSVLALDKRSSVGFSRFGTMTVYQGRVWYSLKRRPRVFFEYIEAWFNSGVVVKPRAATFSIQRLSPQRSRVRVYKGTVAVARAPVASRLRVRAGFETVLRRGRAPSPPAKLTPEPAFWR